MLIIAPIRRGERRLLQKTIHKAPDVCSTEHPVFYEDEEDIDASLRVMTK
jgi:hypothetical protein